MKKWATEQGIPVKAVILSSFRCHHTSCEADAHIDTVDVSHFEFQVRTVDYGSPNDFKAIIEDIDKVEECDDQDDVTSCPHSLSLL